MAADFAELCSEFAELCRGVRGTLQRIRGTLHGVRGTQRRIRGTYSPMPRVMFSEGRAHLRTWFRLCPLCLDFPAASETVL